MKLSEMSEADLGNLAEKAGTLQEVLLVIKNARFEKNYTNEDVAEDLWRIVKENSMDEFGIFE